jgi:2'-5' RNA ligase
MATVAAARELAAFELEIGGAGTFPPGGRPRAIWLGIRQGGDDLANAAARVDSELVAQGWPAESRPFRAHLTLARADGVPAAARIGAQLQELAGAARIPARIDRIGLFESLTGGGPARYEPLELAELESQPPS